MRVWIDIDNPPQVQYLTPFALALADRGEEVLVTARDSGMTLEMLDQTGVAYDRVGHHFGPGTTRKVLWGVLRAGSLVRLLRRRGGASLLLSSSRPSALAARVLGIPAFIMCDYEFVELRNYRRVGASLLFPDVIDEEVFLSQGFTRERLVGFGGIKEDITFSRGAHEAPRPPELAFADELINVLVRPPAEDSHYFTVRSRELLEGLLAFLAGRDDVRMIFSPRQPSQIEHVTRLSWINDPLVLRHAVPAVSLLKAVDWVICAGGTMLREAAYLGVPAIGIFGGEIGSVDRYLAELGAVRLVKDAADLGGVRWREPGEHHVVPHRPGVVGEILEQLERRIAPRGRSTASPN